MNLKSLIISQIKARLSPAKVESFYLCYNIEKNESEIKITEVGNPVKFDVLLDQKESKLIRGLFTTKVLKEAKKDFPDEQVKKIIVQCELIKEELNMFLVFDDNLIKPFNF